MFSFPKPLSLLMHGLLLHKTAVSQAVDAEAAGDSAGSRVNNID
jgi:hypothetical protein